jgi:hypothetical protein
MSYKHVGTAADLVRFGCSLKVECTACGAARTLNGVEVHRINGNRQLSQLAPRLKCQRCCKKAAKLIVLDPIWPDLEADAPAPQQKPVLQHPVHGITVGLR